MKIDTLGAAAVFIGGGLGAITRWILAGLVQEKAPDATFPWGTLTVNLAGSLLLGFAMGAAILHGALTRTERLLIATGYAGALTTFSTLAYETFMLIKENLPWQALLNIIVSLLGGIAMIYIGYTVAGLVYK